MALRFILGVAGAGKTRRVLTEIAGALSGGKDLIYIVPEQFTLQSEADLIRFSGKRSVIQAQVLSFNRLFFRVFSEVGADRGKTIDNIGKNMLIRKLTMDLQSGFKYFSNSVYKHGFIEEVSNAITEFFQYEIPPEALRQIAGKPQTSKTLAGKLSDIVSIYEAYIDYLSNGGIMADDVLSYLAGVIGNSKFVAGSSVWIDGFYGFTGQELKVIGSLLQTAADVTVALTVNEGKTYFNKPSVFDIFSETKQTVNSLYTLAAERKVKVCEPVFLTPTGDSQLAHLRNNFYKPDVSIYNKKGAKGINVAVYDNIYDETENAACFILRLVRDHGYRYRDIAIVPANLDAYKRIIKGVFSRYDIPVFIDAKIDVLSHPLTEFIRSIAYVAYRNWSYESVFRLLKTYVLPIEKNELYDFENYCIEYGMAGYKWQFDEWTAGFGGGRYDKDTVNSIKDTVKTALAPFTRDLKPGVKLSAKEFCERIYAVLEGVNISATLSAWELAALNKCDNQLLLKHRQIWGLLCRVFDQIAEIMGAEQITVSEFAAILDSGIVSVDMGLVPPSVDQVLTGDISRSRLPEIKALIILGLCDGAANPPEMTAFADIERREMELNGVTISAPYKQKMMRQELYLYSLCAKPQDYLFVSCATGADDKTLSPAPVIDKLLRVYPGAGERFLPEDFIETKGSMLSQAGAMLANMRQGAAISDIGRGLIDFYMNDAEYKQITETMNALAMGEITQERLSGETVEKLYANEIITSVSRLENYIQCPFSYFVKYNLRANERNVYQVDYVDLGNLFHTVLEEFSKLLETRRLSWRGLDQEIISGLVAASLEIIVKNDTREVFGASGANRYLIRRAARIAEKSIWALAEHIKMGDFYPYGTEISFKSEPITGITVDAGAGRRFILTGRIDRVDITDFEGKRYIKIIDYKTGAKKFSYTDLYYGMQLQLMLYLDYFIKTSNTPPAILPGGIFYFNIGDPVINANELKSAIGTADAENLHTLNTVILQRFKMSGLMAADADIARAMDNTVVSAAGRSTVINSIQLSAETETGFTKNSAVATFDEFALLREHANTKILEVGNDILRGKIDKHPYKNNTATGCDYCDFSAICKFDLIYETMKYRCFKNFKSVDEVAEALAALRQTVH